MGGRTGRRPLPAIKRRQPRTALKTARTRANGADPIEHVVVLMLENRPFDQVLGGLQPEFAASSISLDGIDPHADPCRNFIQSGPPFEQLPLEAQHVRAALTMPDPMHEATNVNLQLGGDNFYFVLDYVTTYPQSSQVQRELIMRYCPPGSLPAIHSLARSFTVCDRWFASVPGPTWTNRFFVHSGTSIGRVRMPAGIIDLQNIHFYDQDTIYDRLDERNVPWRIYYGDVPHSLILTHQWKLKNKRRYRSFDHFADDVRRPAAEFPAYVFIEPDYMGNDANDDHPPHDVLAGQRLIAEVYNALRGNQDLFDSTLFVLLYDEHGGFYDHVSPPNAVPPDALDYEYDFKRLGVRVPAVLVSPWVDHGVLSVTFDHTSLLKYLIDKWGLGALGERTANANSFASAIRRTGRPRTDVPARLTVAAPTRARAARALADMDARRTRLNDHQEGLLLFSQQLDALPVRPPTPARRARAQREAAAPRERVAGPGAKRAARRRVERFLRSPVAPR